MGVTVRDFFGGKVGFTSCGKGEFCRERFVKEVVRSICKVWFWVKVAFKVFVKMG